MKNLLINYHFEQNAKRLDGQGTVEVGDDFVVPSIYRKRILSFFSYNDEKRVENLYMSWQWEGLLRKEFEEGKLNLNTDFDAMVKRLNEMPNDTEKDRGTLKNLNVIFYEDNNKTKVDFKKINGKVYKKTTYSQSHWTLVDPDCPVNLPKEDYEKAEKMLEQKIEM